MSYQRVSNQPTKDQERSVKLTTLKHRYHKPYQNDWGKATAYARSKIWAMWHMEKEKL